MKNELKTPLLDKVNFPKDLKKFNLEELKQLSSELRSEVIEQLDLRLTY